MTKYSIRVAWSEADGSFVATCPELGDLSALAPTHEEALTELMVAIGLALQTYEEEGWPLPEPQLVEEFSGQFRLRLPRSLHAWAAHQAEHENVSLNTYITTILARARGATESETAVAKEVREAITDLRSSVLASVRSAVMDTAANTYIASSKTFKTGAYRNRDTRTSSISLVPTAD